MPVGTSSRATSTGHTRPVQRTISSSGRRARPGCTRYQWPSSIPSEIAPRNAAPTSTRATDSQAGSPASMPAATRPGRPTSGATRSSTGGNSGRLPSGPSGSGRRSMPVMATIRSLRLAMRSRSPATPALRRTIDTAGAVPAATTASEDASRTGTVLVARPTASAPPAMSM